MNEGSGGMLRRFQRNTNTEIVWHIEDHLLIGVGCSGKAMRPPDPYEAAGAAF